MRMHTKVIAVLAAASMGLGVLAGCSGDQNQGAGAASDTAGASDANASGLVNSVTDKEGIVFTLYLGLVDKDTGTQVLSMQEAKELATPLVSATTGGGYTAIEAYGGYTDDDGNPVENGTLMYTGLHASEQEVMGLIDGIKAALGIESVYVTCEHIGYGIFGGQV